MGLLSQLQTMATRSEWERGHEKTLFMQYANNKGADQPAYSHSLISTFVVRYLVRLISRVSITNISKLLANLCCYAGWFHTCLVKYPEDRFSYYKIRMSFFQDINFNPIAVTLNIVQKTHTV